ncbi:hypothetical protein [Jannaschia donghaensis]|uniref:Uncharacterized protein n=1 Tax=Jannaschia donghaensis TaxID=420998 RepID=A0A0M6YEB7_9RHOB|nr:hypothetical protein [Jannaschia donghaensis]CTQ48668.1 hypothetical protein JDO7802_00672 [Jannaschia donghaensis]
MPHRPDPRLDWIRLPAMAVATAILVFALSNHAQGQEAEAPAIVDMDIDRMEAIVRALDAGAERADAAFRLTVEDVPVLIVTDPRADRMRVMVPIRAADGLTPEDLQRMMQANFDSALDARYAIAEGRVWAVFIHPLRSLRRDQLISGIGQTVNAATTYGTLFSSGAGQFGRGDSRGEQQKLLERLQDRGQDI